MARAALFDLDGTLVNSAPAIVRALNIVIERRGGKPVDVNLIRPWISLGAAEIVRVAYGSLASDASKDVTEFRSVYSEFESDPTDLYPSVLSTMQSLHASGVRLGICTNKPEKLAMKLIAEVGLHPYLQIVVAGDPLLPAKPHPHTLQLALERIGVQLGSAVYIGDSEIDAEAAAAAGIPFILATFGYAGCDPASILCAARF